MIKLDTDEFKVDCDSDNWGDLLGNGIFLGCGGYSATEIRLYIYMKDKWPNVLEFDPDSVRFGHFFPAGEDGGEVDTDYTATIYMPARLQAEGWEFRSAEYQDRQGHRIEIICRH